MLGFLDHKEFLSLCLNIMRVTMSPYALNHTVNFLIISFVFFSEFSFIRQTIQYLSCGSSLPHSLPVDVHMPSESYLLKEVLNKEIQYNVMRVMTEEFECAIGMSKGLQDLNGEASWRNRGDI